MAAALVALPEHALAEWASSVLAVVLDRTSGLERPESGTPASLRLHAFLIIGVRSFRAIRATMAVLAAGYELEAHALARLVLELEARRNVIAADSSGSEAHAWMSDQRNRDLGAMVRAATPDSPRLWKTLSRAVHADAVAVFDVLLSDQEGERVLRWGPGLTLVSRRVLFYLALSARSTAIALATEAGVEMPDEERLSLALSTGHDRLSADLEGAT